MHRLWKPERNRAVECSESLNARGRNRCNRQHGHKASDHRLYRRQEHEIRFGRHGNLPRQTCGEPSAPPAAASALTSILGGSNSVALVGVVGLAAIVGIVATAGIVATVAIAKEKE